MPSPGSRRSSPSTSPTSTPLHGARRRFLGRGRVGRRGPRLGQRRRRALRRGPRVAHRGRRSSARCTTASSTCPASRSRVWHDRPDVLDRMARCLGRRYGVRLPSISANLYRDGQRLRRLARRPHRPRPGRRGGGDPVARLHPHAAAAPRRWRPVDRVPDAVRRPARAGRHLPAHLRALRPQARPRRPPHQRHVPKQAATSMSQPARPQSSDRDGRSGPHGGLRYRRLRLGTPLVRSSSEGSGAP